MAEDAVGGPLPERDLHHELRVEPPGGPEHRGRWWWLER